MSLVMNARGRFDGTRTTAFIEVQKKKRVRKESTRHDEKGSPRGSVSFTFYLDAVCQLIYNLAQYLAMLTKAMKVRGFLARRMGVNRSRCSFVRFCYYQSSHLPTFHDSAKFVYFAIGTLTLSGCVYVRGFTPDAVEVVRD